ncbi:MAG: biotin--protein ligase [Desulfovibrio sp.]|nr:biotin--protein ligase [Desulfovibrio sp.]
MTRVFVLWDDSHLWGLLVLRALRALGVPHGILRANQIAEGALSGKPRAFGPAQGGSAPSGDGGSGLSGDGTGASSPLHSLLIVPGGWARGRALRLGEAGRAAIRDFVAVGGSYLGFCGGAGLALTSPRPGESLGICPWGRMGFAGRLQHFLSGDVRLALAPQSGGLNPPGGGEALAQVWWPAQFAPSKDENDGVEVLARYYGLGPDFWVADLALSRIPEEALSDWENLYGLQVRPHFLSGRPAVISGRFGAGRYLLSYPHLETPDSPQANAWLAHILAGLSGADCAQTRVPPWNVGAEAPRWADAVLLEAKAALREVIALGQEHLLLFWRTPWLIGWRRGIPGPGINSLYALVCEALASPPPAAGSPAEAFWLAHAEEFRRLAALFCKGLSGLLLAERLDMTVRQTPGVDGADDVFSKNLRDMRLALFGPPPSSGGVGGQLLGMLEELLAGMWVG